MHDQLIDPVQVELLIEEIRRDPANEDDWAKELITLYNFQQELIRKWGG